MNVNIEESWKEVLSDEFEKPYFQEMAAFLHRRKEQGAVIYPRGKDIFKAFELTPFYRVKVVILGQDPYHNPGQAMGLSFSVPDEVPAPPSLKNIFKEIESDLGVRLSGRPNLEKWALQGVLMLNATLTVEAGQANSHSRIGWQTFTDKVIEKLSQEREGIVFLLWGRFAREKKALIDGTKHLVLEAAHPSPLAGGAFFGCRHFSQTNQWLASRGQEPIDWTL
ncbi:MAG: uracil-DNA glycosylase [Bacteroidales bacterium]|nr:uracil-DNA glycosylase [Bacteroidales bacterium]